MDYFLNAFPTDWTAKHKMATMFDNMFACSVRRLARSAIVRPCRQECCQERVYFHVPIILYPTPCSDPL